MSDKTPDNSLQFDFLNVIKVVLQNPIVICATLIYFLHVLQRMMVRIDDIETK